MSTKRDPLRCVRVAQRKNNGENAARQGPLGSLFADATNDVTHDAGIVAYKAGKACAV